MRCETGDMRQETWGRRHGTAGVGQKRRKGGVGQETLDRRRWTGDVGQETGDRRQKTGASERNDSMFTLFYFLPSFHETEPQK